MAVQECVKTILCPLGNSVLSALNGIISAQVAFLQGELAVITAQLVTLEVQLLPIQVVRGVANAAVAEVRAAGNLVPVAIMADCFDLGDMQMKLNASLDASVASVNQILNEANRILSFKAELEAEVAEIQATIEKLNGIKFALSECS